MPIDYKTVAFEDLDAESFQEFKASIDALMDSFNTEKASLKAKVAEVLGEKKKLSAQLKPWEKLQSELEITDVEEVSELVIKARSVTVDPDNKNPLADQVRDLTLMRERERQEHNRAIADKAAAFETERTAWQKSLAEKQEELRQTIIQTKLHQALAGKLVDPADAGHLLRKKNFRIDLADSEDDVPLSQREIVAFEGNQTVGTDLPSILERLEKDPTVQHYLKATFVAGGGGFNPSNRSTNESNPWAKDSFNRTQQLLISQLDPAKAARLQEAAK